MFQWLASNWGTILVVVILIAVVTAVIIKLIKNKKAGKSSCGCDCSTCSGVCSTCRTPCHKN